MGKVFRFHEANDGEDWFTSGKFSAAQVEDIVDPSGQTAAKQVTSIPSPFARYDLVKSAFRDIVSLEQVGFDYWYEGGTPKLYHKLVSDTLDLLQLVFMADSLGDRLQIISWDRKKDLESLLGSHKKEQVLLGETLQLFLDQDAEAYNFREIDRVYMIEVDYKVIGGTSPCTLFCTSANSFDSIGQIKFGQHQLFSESGFPLFKRDREFVFYLYRLKKAFPEFSEKFMEVSAFLDRSLELFRDKNRGLYNELNVVLRDPSSEAYESSYEYLTTGKANDIVEVLGFALRKRNNDDFDIEKNSGFVISSTKPLAGKRPLVLEDGFSKPVRYVSDVWEKGTSVPFYVEEPIADRKLPGQDVNYPWITVSDFLEPYLIKVDYPINDNRFFDANIQHIEGNEGYLPPLTETFFQYFHIDDLTSGFVKIEMKKVNNEVEVSLKIPVNESGLMISFERKYQNPPEKGRIPDVPDLYRNEGKIVQLQFTLNLFPCVKISPSVNVLPDYRMQLIEADDGDMTQNKYDIQFVDQGNNYLPFNTTNRLKKDMNISFASVNGYVLDDHFEYLRIKVDSNGRILRFLIIPIWLKYDGTSAPLDFAVDFGTTNTHIECREGSKVFSFELNDKNNPTATLMDRKSWEERDLDPFSRQFFFSTGVENNQNYSFPTRTSLFISKSADLDSSRLVMADTNIPLLYESERLDTRTQDIETNLKWQEDEHNRQVHAEVFFEEIILLLRAKLLVENRDFKDVRLLWFYPASMNVGMVNQLKSYWSNLFQKYITKDKDSNILSLSESIVPYFFYNKKLQLSSMKKPVLSIDIGGGTTDVIVYKGNRPQILTSFRFAANSLFGNFFSDFTSPEDNGFVKKYDRRMSGLLKKNNAPLHVVQNQIKARNKSEELISFWFSLEKNPSVKNKDILSFSKMLRRDSDMKILFLLFYSSIIYHISRMLRSKDLLIPSFITFSGTGSKILDLISEGNDSSLEELTQTIFNKVFEVNESEETSVELMRDIENAKQITCKGALMAKEREVNVPIKRIKTIYQDNLSEEKKLIYRDIFEENGTVSEIVSGVDQFFDFFTELDIELDFENTFLTNPMYTKLLREHMKESTEIDINDALESKNDEDLFKKPLDETLFFYPIIGIIQRVAEEIARDTELTE